MNEDVDALALQLNEICRTATIDLVFRVGEFIILRLFNGSVDSWERGGVRRVSFRTLAKRDDLILSSSALCRAVSIYVLIQRSGGRQHWRHLSASHFQEVLSLPTEQQRALLAEAERERWSVLQLRAEAGAQRHGHRRRISTVARDLRVLSARLSKCRREIECVTAELAGDGLARLQEGATLVRHALDAFEGALDARAHTDLGATSINLERIPETGTREPSQAPRK
jgi:hypothetical protein